MRVAMTFAATGAAPEDAHPPLARAPFNAGQAGDFQKQWAGHIGKPPVYTNSIGMELKLIPPGADPLGPDNVLVLSLGVTTGAAISGQSRVTATAKSPLSDAIGDAQAGGFWPAEAKGAGFDAYVITGRAEKPVYLWVQDGEAELRDA